MKDFSICRVQYTNWPALQSIQFATFLANKGKGLRHQIKFCGVSYHLCKFHQRCSGAIDEQILFRWGGCRQLSPVEEIHQNLWHPRLCWTEYGELWHVFQVNHESWSISATFPTFVQAVFYINFLQPVGPHIRWWDFLWENSERTWRGAYIVQASTKMFKFVCLVGINEVLIYLAVGRWPETDCGLPDVGHGYTGRGALSSGSRPCS